MKKLTQITLIAIFSFILYGCTAPIPPPSDLSSEVKHDEDDEREEVIEEKTEEKKAEDSLMNFFNHLNNGEYAKALEIFSPREGSFDSWEGMESFTPPEERESRVLILKNYCEVVGTCYKIEIIGSEKIAYDEYEFTLKFIDDNGNIVEFGPCCGATEETQPTQTEFKYKVKKIGNKYRVITTPVYQP